MAVREWITADQWSASPSSGRHADPRRSGRSHWEATEYPAERAESTGSDERRTRCSLVSVDRQCGGRWYLRPLELGDLGPVPTDGERRRVRIGAASRRGDREQESVPRQRPRGVGGSAAADGLQLWVHPSWKAHQMRGLKPFLPRDNHAWTARKSVLKHSITPITREKHCPSQCQGDAARDGGSVEGPNPIRRAAVPPARGGRSSHER
jgi:hypothetical protein